MQKYAVRKMLACGIILLFVGTSFPLQTGSAVVKKENSLSNTLNGNTLYVGGSGPGNYSDTEDNNIVFDKSRISLHQNRLSYPLLKHMTIQLSPLLEERNKTYGVAEDDPSLSVREAIDREIITTGCTNLYGEGILHNNSINEVSGQLPLLLGIVYVDNDADQSWYDHTHVRTIQEGINNATAGDTVFVYSGIYYENVIINKTISLFGENRNSTIIDGSGNSMVIYVSTGHVNIGGFTIQNGGRGISLFSSNGNNIIDDNIVKNNEVGILILNSNNNTIVHNNISNNNIGMQHFTATNDLIANNTFSSSACNIALDHTSRSTFADNSFSKCLYGINIYYAIGNNFIRNTFTNSGLIVIESSYQNIITDNTVNGKPLIYLEDISGEVINNPTSAGQIILLNCSNITIKDQEITRTSFGIELWNTHNCSIANNIISNSSIGLFLGSSRDNKIANNIIIDNTIQLEGGGWGIALIMNCNNNLITTNSISRNLIGVTLQVSSNYNHLYHNNLLNNIEHNAYDDGNNNWDNGYPSGGNHWSDYSDIDVNGDGLGDTSYNIFGGSNQDHYPLIHPFVIGDLNVDGSVNFGDINPFVMALCDPSLYQSTYHILPSLHGDINQDGTLNFGDINPFVYLLTNG